MKSFLGHFNVRLILTFVFFIGINEILARNIFRERPKASSARIEIFQNDGSVLKFERMVSNTLSASQFSWSGNTQDDNGYLTLAVVGEKIRGSVLSPESNFQFKGNLDNQAIFSSAPRVRPCGGCKMTQPTWRDPRPGSAAQTKHAWRKSDAGVIDLMVIYPTIVRKTIGSEGETLSEIKNAVAGANLCFRNSEVPLQIRLVHTYETDYSPTGILVDDLNKTTLKDDGVMDEIHTLRDQYGADIVTLLVEDSDMGGLANTLSYPSLSFAESAFNVCVWDQIGAPTFTLAHEIGHNMGCLHNREDASDSSQISDYDYGAFAYGKRWFLNGEGYRTVMAYNDSDKSYKNSIPYFSNPAISYLGVATGNEGTENNAMALKISTPYVANFRDSKIQGILPSVFSIEVMEGNYSTLGVRLSSQPTGQVQINLSLSNGAAFLLGSSSTLTFDQNNWNLRQPVQVVAVGDADNGDETGLLTFSGLGLTSVDVNLKLKDRGTSEKTGQHYFTGTVVNPYGYGLEGVTLSFSSAENYTVSDQNGSFFTNVSTGYSGVVTPSKSGYSFSPQSVSINSLGNHSTGHTFVASRSSVVYVDQQATGKNDGSSWSDAFSDLTTALATVDSFSEVWVAKGTYLPGRVRSASFVLPGGVLILGGFAGGETSSSARDFSKNETILSGDLGMKGNSADNSYHVLVPLDGALLDGFIIEDGNATENFSDDRGKGGALWAENVAFQISNCEFRNNWARQGGGGIWVNEVNATFENCRFTTNSTCQTGSGGAVWSIDSNLTLTSCNLTSNKSGHWGGALRIDNGNLSLKNCSLLSNESMTSNGGGAIYQNAGTFSISSSSLSQNKSTYQGGAILIRDANGSVTDSNFTDNQNSISNGGGALFIENSSPELRNCNFIRNKTEANSFGGAIKLVNSNSKIENCTFKYNQNPKNSGGAIYIDQTSAPSLKNNEFQYNHSASWGGAIYCESQEVSISGGFFLGNWADYGGGVATNGTSQSNFDNIRILGNEANASSNSQGGFLYLGTGSTHSKFVNCVIAGNKSAYRHGVFSPKGTTQFLHCSIVANEAKQQGGVAILFSNDILLIENSIVWQNSAPTANEIWVNQGTVIANYSIFDPDRSMGTISGVSNLNQDPLFYDSSGMDKFMGTLDDDLRLLSSSPAINAGYANTADQPSTDLASINRDSKPDLGAYEYFENTSPSYLGKTSFAVNEGNSSITKMEATDPDGHALLFSIIGGKDETKITVESQNGSLSFTTNPDYEYPGDSDGDNRYEITLGISDGYVSIQTALVIDVLDIDESAKTPEDSTLLINGYSIGNNWRQASWFGTYYSQYFPWVYHTSMGWLYIVQSSDGETWMWRESLGWLWTDLDIFPHFFLQSSQLWGYSGSDSREGQYYLFETGNSGWVDF